MNYAERSFSLNAIGDDGFSLRERTQGRLKRARKPEKIKEYREALALPPFPKSLNYVWSAFSRLRQRKPPAQEGRPSPIEWQDIDAFCRRILALNEWEISIIEDLDNLYMAAN